MGRKRNLLVGNAAPETEGIVWSHASVARSIMVLLDEIRASAMASRIREAPRPNASHLLQQVCNAKWRAVAAFESRSTNRPRIAIYARSASANQGGAEEAVSQQIGRLSALCVRRRLVLAGSYADPAISGRTATRAGLQQLLSDASRDPRPFDLVLVEDRNRISRSLATRRAIGLSLRERGLIMVTASDLSYDS